ncbi:MAG TPA: type IV pilus twitching motility protein PilT [Candidatus Hydrogenedentes bacterium]|nr:type IV pilus twitching motility protein PilT [Candidatus Hydrogenedentota bacterium]HIJ73450.1 type IV pilus twitching motility protein PilT [Candidatus Hydrogenedentota bacterium]
MTMEELMRGAVEKDASDIHLKTGNPPIYRIDGDLVRLDGPPLTEDDVTSLFGSIASPADIDKFRKVMELDISYVLGDVARFRVNICKDDGHTRIVLRVIPVLIKTIEELGLPPVLKRICGTANGLCLVTGPTGSGKSTTLASMINEINDTRPAHVVTVEDPLEFLHKDKKAIITQREIGHDTLSFANALRGALRQDPDVILIGEMRDAETVRTALASAETGHLVFSTLHTVDAVETLNRIIDFFEPHQQIQVRKQLASVLRAVVSQRILPLKTRSGRCVAAELLIGTRAVRDFIEQGKSFKDIVKLIEDGQDQYGMQTFDQALFDLVQKDRIDEATALRQATSARDLKRRLEGLR